MATKKNVNVRVQNKHDIEANWALATNFVPLEGEIIVYDADANVSYPRFKIGDGVSVVNNLPFQNYITMDEIDEICGQTIEVVTATEGEF